MTDLIIQQIVQNDIFVGLGLGMVLALPDVAKYYLPQVSLPSAPGNDTGLYAAATDSITAMLGQSVRTIQVTVTSTGSGTPIKLLSTTTTTIVETATQISTINSVVPTTLTHTERETSWTTVVSTTTHTDITTSHVPTTIIKPSTTTQTLYKNHDITSYLHSGTSTETKWTTYTKTETERSKATATVSSDSASSAKIGTPFPYSILTMLSWLAALGWLLVAASAYYLKRLYRQLQQRSKPEWFQHSVKRVQDERSARLQAEQARNEARTAEALVKRQLKSQEIESQKALETLEKSIENERTKLERLRAACGVFHADPVEDAYLDHDSTSEMLLELWRREKNNREEAIRTDSVREWNKTKKENEVLHARVEELEPEVDRLKAQIDKSGNRDKAAGPGN